MSVAAQTLRPPSRTLMFLEGRALPELGAFLGALPLLGLAPHGDGHPVLVLPGLVASDTSTRPLRTFLKTRVYEMASGRRADEEDGRFGGSLAGSPPVPTTAIFSRSDGICAWQGCREQSSHMAESIEVESSHCGMGHHPAAVYAVAERLAQKEGEWAPFDRSGWRSLVYPDPHR